jgi:hypothetical protein
MDRIEKERAKSRGEEMFPKLAEQRGNVHVIKDQLPTIFHIPGIPPGEIPKVTRSAVDVYRSTLSTAYQALLDRFQLHDVAIKVVGVGSVGTLCWVFLFMAEEGDPLFLQVKEARTSVLEPYAGRSVFANRGQRIVDGYRRMQPATDIFLGWSHGPDRHFFVRQLRDMKLSVMVETFKRVEMEIYARWCGRALALAHARSGNPSMISGYLGKSDVFDNARGICRGLRRPEREGPRRAGTRGPRRQDQGGVRGGEMIAGGEPRFASTPDRTGSGLKTPRAAAVAGILFSLLLITSLVLVRITVPADPRDAGAWLSGGARTTNLAVHLLPFAGIAFLWFIGVVRDRLGQQEDKFLATVFLGSGLLFLATMFAAAAVAGGLLRMYASTPARLIESGLYTFGRTVSDELINVYALRMAAVFMISTCTLSLRTGIIPRWITYIGLVLALFMLLSLGRFSWAALVFPLWVLLISVHILMSNLARTGAASVSSTQARQ